MRRKVIEKLEPLPSATVKDSVGKGTVIASGPEDELATKK